MAEETHSAGAMPAFLDYPGLGGGYALLWNTAKEKRLSHAYLLGGPRGVGKATFARWLVASLFCEHIPAPCGECEACRRVFSGGEPDVTEVLSPDDKPISIERVRQVIAQISQHSFGSGTRVVIIEPAEKLTPAAQNCLLKSLEEPPADVLFLLLSHEPGALLGTIASRCSLVKLAPWPDDRLRATLSRLGYPPQPVSAAIARAGGVIGQAIAILSDETAQAGIRERTEAILAVRRDSDAVALSTKFKDERAGADQTLSALETAFQQALMVITGQLPLQAASGSAIREWCQKSNVAQLTGLIQAVFDTRRQRQSQVNWQAGIDRLLITILEAKTRWQP